MYSQYQPKMEVLPPRREAISFRLEWQESQDTHPSPIATRGALAAASSHPTIVAAIEAPSHPPMPESSRSVRSSANQFVITLLAASTVLFGVARLVHAQTDKPAAESIEFFEKNIRPLFISRCQDCHGDKKSWANLRLDSMSNLKKGGENGAVVVAGKPSESELYRRITSSEDGVQMPPPDSGKKLSPVEIEHLKHWIELGAIWPEDPAVKGPSNSPHWAFQPLTHPEPPPQVAGESANPIDRFIAAKRQEHGLSSSLKADRRTIIRRASYDLLGLPPSSAEVEAFSSDQDANAFEKLVDRLLLSPRYGEQWARHWLDVARFSDTKGYVYAREEREFYHAAHYRDWVIKAFNDDLPYDRFLLLQLAADQAAKEDPQQLAAMGYLTLGRRFLGVESDVIDDKIDVVSRGMLGLTVGCARCHDHKYDPIPTADYYSLYGVFQNCIERSAALPRGDQPAPDEKYLAGLADREKKLSELITLRRNEAANRIRNRVGDYLYALRELEKYPDASFNTFTTKDDIIPGIVIRWEEFLSECKRDGHTILGAWLAFADLPNEQFAEKAPAIAKAVAEDTKLHPTVAALFQTVPASAREVADRIGKLFVDIDQKWEKAQADAKAANAPLPTALPDANEELLRKFLYESPSPCVVPPESVGATEWWWDLNTVVELWGKQADLDRWYIQGQESNPRAVYLVDAPFPLTPRIFKRGNVAAKGASVPRQFLSALSAPDRKPFANGSGRFELAQSIIDPKNPLTARVWVNRVWSHHFGKGLVTSPSDFGLRASPPSHPELLDWLASEFIAHGWSNRWLHQVIMTSDTYQQSNSGPQDAKALAQAREVDPENRYLWRMPTRRLAWEEQRDTLLRFADELDSAMGGKSVEAFSPGANGKFRRSVYNRVDRQYLPGFLSAFDFANPDMHSPQRSDTTVPQQALFLLNHPFVAGRAKSIAKHIAEQPAESKAILVNRLFDTILQRKPTDSQLNSAVAFLESADAARIASLSGAEPSPPSGLSPLEQLAQLLLISNEVLFVD